MKIHLAQINPVVGQFNQNVNRMLKAQEGALEADLIVYPELSLIGYPPQDLLLKRHFIDAQLSYAEVFARNSDVPSLFGMVDRVRGKLYNSAAFCVGGHIVSIFHKTLLPNYDVFDEKRYFESGVNLEPLVLDGHRIGVTICEDIWEDDYKTSVIGPLVEAGAEFIVNLSASPWSRNKADTRFRIINKRIQEYSVPIVYVNQVGGQDELIFDGSSVAVDVKGNVIAQLPSFEEGGVTIDTNLLRGHHEPVAIGREIGIDLQRMGSVFSALVLGVKDYARKTGFTKAVIGMSGGIDSTVVACIAKQALGGENVLGVSMPSVITSQGSMDEAAHFSERLGIEFVEVPIRHTVDSLNQAHWVARGERLSGLALENVQARARGNILMNISNMENRLVLSTGNKTEIALGYCTLYGDMTGGLCPIGDIEKPDVYNLARHYNEYVEPEVKPISEFVLTRPPTAELAEDQVDPFYYPAMAKIVDAIVEGHHSPEEVKAKMSLRSDLVPGSYDADAHIKEAFDRIRLSQFKRFQSSPIIRVTEKAFGMGRRMPIVNHFKW